MREYNFHNNSLDTFVHKTRCIHCNEVNHITLDTTSYNNWYEQKQYTQDAFPHLDSGEREIIQTGIHPDCWNEMFPEED